MLFFGLTQGKTSKKRLKKNLGKILANPILSLTRHKSRQIAARLRLFPRALKKFLEISMEEQWRSIENFPDYSVSNLGRIRTDKTGRILRLNENQFGLLQVGMMRDGTQYHRSVPLLVAKAFLPERPEPFDTPINLDGDRHNNQVDNLVWRPRWFAIRYNQQFRYPHLHTIQSPIIDLKTKEVSQNSRECAMKYGLLEEDLVFSILNRTYVWPTYQEFGILEEE